jgi:hypothetical protein
LKDLKFSKCLTVKSPVRIFIVEKTLDFGFEEIMTKLKYDRELQTLKLDNNLFDVYRLQNHYPAFMELFIVFNTTIKVLSMKNCFQAKDERGAD